MSLTTMRTAVLVVVAALLLSACDFSVYKLPLPGGADTGDNPLTVTVEFRDVLDLVPQSTVKVNDVNVGKVTDIDLDGQTAVVELEIRNDTELPADAVAEIRQTSLLGEKFVQLAAPADSAELAATATDGEVGLLADGARIPLERSGRNPEVEEVLAALSLVLNGGGIAQLKTIAGELNLALEGREGSAKSVLRQVDTLVTTLDDNRDDIVDAIDSLNELSKSANSQERTIKRTLDDLPAAVESLDGQRDDLVKALRALNRLSGTGVRVIKASKNATIDTLKQLTPVLNKLADSGDDLVNSFQVFLTYPFVDEVIGRDPQVARNLHMGDYTNLSIQLDLNLDGTPPTIPGLPEEVCIPFHAIDENLADLDLTELCNGARERLSECLNDLVDGDADIARCARFLTGTVEDLANVVCATPLGALVGALCPARPRSGGDGGGSGSGLPDPLGLGGLLGLNRAPLGADPRPTSGTGATLGELMQAYDPDLVSLLVPATVTR
ncbi:MCE family protein [Nocardioides pacificus]